MARSHDVLVAAQFGPRAQAYVDSKDHAQGADLERLATLVAVRRPLRALDLGCGGGHVSFTLAPFADAIVAYDLSHDMLDAVRRVASERGFANITTEHGAAECLPFPDASFDLVASRYSAHHWRNLQAGLGEIRRVLKPDGLAILMDAAAPETALDDTVLQSIELLRDPTHVRDYKPSEWVAALQAAGLEPGEPQLGSLHLDFTTWIARSATPDIQVRAIRALQDQMPQSVIDRFEIEADGSFWLPTLMIEAKPILS